MFKRQVLFAFVAAALVWANPARADYVCQSQLQPTAVSSLYGYGDGGLLITQIMTAKNCTGTIVGTYYFCTTGATSGFCATAANCGGVAYLYSSSELQHLSSLLQQAEVNDQSVAVTHCLNASLPELVHFYSN